MGRYVRKANKFSAMHPSISLIIMIYGFQTPKEKCLDDILPRNIFFKDYYWEFFLINYMQFFVAKLTFSKRSELPKKNFFNRILLADVFL